MSIFLVLGQQRLKAALAYRGDLVASALSNVLIVSTGLVFLLALMDKVPRMGAWSREQMVFAWGFAECAIGLLYLLFGGLFVANHRYILGGELDRTLLRPANPLGQLLAENLGIDDISVILVGLGVMGWAAPGIEGVPHWRWLPLPVFLMAATLTLGGLLIGFVSVGLRLHHRGTAVGLVSHLAIFNRYPIDLFGAPLRWLLTFGLPLAFAGFYPASFFLGTDAWLPYALATPLVALGTLSLGYAAWSHGLRSWSSTGT
ncbi:MAG: ABC-2 family transporter protein [Deltaproteobacteria bacterium]|nr:ABC-2 family transporter protein [Deltaproteobacteria bacterium]